MSRFSSRLFSIMAGCLLSAAATPCCMAQLLISELLYQPKSHQTEWVELYNPTDNDINLQAFHIVRCTNDSLSTHYPLPSFLVPAHRYVVLSKDTASVIANHYVPYRDMLVQCKLPTYANSGGSVVLTTADSIIIDRLEYYPTMHNLLLVNAAGVSLERVSFLLPTNDITNWHSASSLSHYGTPTAPNSVLSDSTTNAYSFSLQSTTISPDNDDYNDSLILSYHLPRHDLLATMEVYDALGRMVARPLNAHTLGSHGRIVWDGRDINHNPCPTGRYVIMIRLYDGNNSHKSIRKTLNIRYK